MSRISPVWYLCIFVAFAAWVPVAYFRGELLEARAVHAEYVAGAERASTEAQAEARRLEREWRANLEEVQNNAKIQVAALGAALTRADSASSQLREQLDLLSERFGEHSAAAFGSPSTAYNCGMLADLLGQADALAGKYAEAADRSRVAGEACEAAYKNLEGAKHAGQVKR